MDTPTKLITLLTGALGIWLMAVPFVVGSPSLDRLNDVVVGGLIATASGYNYSRERVRGAPSKGVSGLLVFLGGWLLVAPFLTGVTGTLRWNDVAVGVLVTAFAGYTAYAAPSEAQTVTQTPTNET